MARIVYNPTDTFDGIRFRHGKVQMQQIEASFDPANYTFQSGESDVIRAGAGILINDQLCIAHVDFLPGEPVEVAICGGVYEMAASAAINEFAGAFVDETDDGGAPAAITGLALSGTAGASPIGTNLTQLGAAGTAEFVHELAPVAAV